MSSGPPPDPDDDAPADDPVAGDALPEDLDVTAAYAGPYTFPDVRRRRVAGACYLVIAGGCAIAAVTAANAGLATAAGFLVLVAAYHFACAWPLRIDETEALAAAARTVGFPIGHASAQLGWRGLRSRPSWRILLYSADEPPSLRGLVELDAVDGTVLGEHVEENPEDWSEYGFTGGGAAPGSAADDDT